MAIGYDTMLTTSNGHYYGEEYGRRQSVKNAQLMETDAGRRRMRSLYHYYKEIGKEQKADAILKNNLEKKKCNNRRSSADHGIKAYINAEINRMLQTEKPAVIYQQKLAWGNQNEMPKYVKVRLSKWQKGYIRDRIIYKCKTEGIHLQEVFVTNDTCCSRCGEPGVRDARGFFCQVCQRNVRVGVNTAENVLKQGREIMHTVSG